MNGGSDLYRKYHSSKAKLLQRNGLPFIEEGNRKNKTKKRRLTYST